MMGYASSSSNVALAMFEKMMEAKKAALMAEVTKMIQPLVDEGRKALEEFVADESRLADEKFSRN